MSIEYCERASERLIAAAFADDDYEEEEEEDFILQSSCLEKKNSTYFSSGVICGELSPPCCALHRVPSALLGFCEKETLFVWQPHPACLVLLHAFPNLAW